MTKLKLSNLVHTMRRRGSWEKTVMLGQRKTARKEKASCEMDPKGSHR